MDQYAVFYSRDPETYQLNLNEPYAAVKLSGKAITLTGTQKFVNDWRHYFAHGAGWMAHLQKPQPLISMATTSTMGNMVAYDYNDGQQKYETALNNLENETITIELGEARPITQQEFEENYYKNNNDN